jgi:hypothetical protein
MRTGAWMLDTSTRIAPMQILLDRGLSQAGVLDRGLSHATWASYWSHGAFWTRQRLMTRDFASLHPCRQAAYFLPCARPPDACGSCLDRPRQRRPEGSRDRYFQAFAVTRAGTDTMPTRRDDDEEITADAASAPARGVRAPRFGPRGASMTPPAPERPATPDDLRTALGPPTSFGVTLFAINVGCPADRPRPPSRIHSEDHIISQRFSPPSTGCISGGHTSLSLYW